MKPSTLGIPLLVGLAIVVYLAEIGMFPPAEKTQRPELKLSQPQSEPSKPKPSSYRECMWFSNEQYKRDMSKFNWIRSQPEVNYGRLRDDKYGKGLNTITKEKLEREKKCFEDGMSY